MPLGQIAAVQESLRLRDGGDPEAPARKNWAIPIRSPEDLARLWEERQARRGAENAAG